MNKERVSKALTELAIELARDLGPEYEDTWNAFNKLKEEVYFEPMPYIISDLYCEEKVK